MWRLPKRVVVFGSAVLLGRLAWTRWARGRTRGGIAHEQGAEEDFPDTVPTVWSSFPDLAAGESTTGRHGVERAI
jgi:hypothetical protein